jgi:nucleoside phosphorylase
VFLGYAGGLTNEVHVGEVYEVDTAITIDGDYIDLFCSTSLPRIKCGYSPSLLGTPAVQYTALAHKFHCDSVDMETVYCAKASEEHNHRFSSYLLITDKPGVKNFWELNSKEKKAIEVGTKRLVGIIISLCEEMNNNV